MEFLKAVSLPYNITDMAVDQFNNKIIFTGKKTFVYSGTIKEFPSHLSNSRMVSYIKKENQLFFTTSFLIACENGKIFECNSNSVNKYKLVFEKNNADIITTTSSKLIYVEGKNLILNKINDEISISKEINFINTQFEDDKLRYIFDFEMYSYKDYLFKVIVSDGKIILKIRKINNEQNVIKIYESENLNELFNISINNNHLFSKIIGTNYYAINNYGQIEKWNIIKQELEDVIYFKGTKISYFDNYDDKIYIVTTKGEFIEINDDFKIVNKYKICSSEIRKFIILNDEIKFLDVNNKLYIYSKKG